MNTRTLCLAVMLLTLAAGPLLAIPAGFNVQGRLTDANGVNKDGTFSIKFSIYSGPNTGADLKWYRTIPSVAVKNGNFQVVLSGLGENSIQLETAVKDLSDAYVEIQVGSDPPLSPRQQLLRSPFTSESFVLGKEDVLIQSDNDANSTGRIVMRTGNTDRVTVANNGNVGIGTADPAEKLSVAGNLAVSGALSADNFVGSMMFFITPVCPAGWLAADGRSVSETNYQKLADAMGKHGVGTFTLPDLRGMFVRGWDSAGGTAKGIDAGRILGSEQQDELKSHMHSGILKYGTNQTMNYVQSKWHGAYQGSTDSSGGVETRPKNVALLPCIKY